MKKKINYSLYNNHLQFDIEPNCYISFDFDCPVRPYMLFEGEKLPNEFFDLLGTMQLVNGRSDFGCGEVAFAPVDLPSEETIRSILRMTPFTKQDLIYIREVVSTALYNKTWNCVSCQ